MRRKSLLLVVGLLAVASLMAAMAYNSASVTNAASMTVENTTNSLLALNAIDGVGNKDKTAWVDTEGRLNFNFARGTGQHPAWLTYGELYGLQRGSTYTWNELFSVKNNSKDSVVYRIDAVDMPYITVTAVKAAGAGINVPFVENGTNNTNGLGLVPGDTGVIKVSFTIPEELSEEEAEDIVQTFAGSLIVKARAAESVGRHNPVTY